MITQSIVALVEFCRRYAALVIFICTAATVGAGWYAAHHFQMNTDVNQLLSADLPWRKNEKALEAAFPQKNDTMLIVVEGDTPDSTENAAAALTAKLQSMPQLFKAVSRPDSIPFFRKNGLLFLSKQEISEILDSLVQAQPMLGTITSDPSLRGFFSTIALMAQGVQAGALDRAQFDKPITAITDAVEATLSGHDKPIAWQSLMSDKKPSTRDLRKFILTNPILDYTELQPGFAATTALRTAINELQLTPAHGIHVRLTGSVPLADEEFSSVAEGTSTATLLSGILVLLILLLALRSLRLTIPILITLGAGLCLTTAFALAVIGSLNLISVAFAVMFIGIAVDFGIQFGVRYRDQRHQEPDHIKAMHNTAQTIALPLAMAAGSTALGFLAFIPTDYRGVSELGIIAGAGMIIAFILNITLLPALLAFFCPPAEKEAQGYRWAAPLDAAIIRHRRFILISAAFIAIIAGGITTQLRFDFDPLNIKDQRTESVATLFDLMRDPDFSFYTVDILRPSLEEAQKLADALSKLPEVDHVMTLASFVPEDQTTKLAMIDDTKTLLEPTLSLPVVPAPSHSDNKNAIVKASAALKTLTDSPTAQSLAQSLDRVVVVQSPKLFTRLTTNIIGSMQPRIENIRTILAVEPVTVESITDDLRQDWVTKDGQYLVQAHPKGNPREHTTLTAFTNAVRSIAPDAAGTPISIQASSKTVTGAFIDAGIYALAAIFLLALLILRKPMDVIRLLTPLILAGILTLATIVLIGLPLNFANIIALPLLLSLGVSYAIYFVSYWQSGKKDPLQSSMARAVLFSAATTLVAFGTLSLSTHPGTAGMGELLTIALLYSLLCTFFVLPALLGIPKGDKQS